MRGPRGRSRGVTPEVRPLPKLGERPMPRTPTTRAGTTPGPAPTPAMAAVLALSCPAPATRAHDEEPVVDPSRWLGPIDPRLDDAGQTIVFSCQGALWRMPRGGGAMTRLTGGPRLRNPPAPAPGRQRGALIPRARFAPGGRPPTP